MAEKKKTDRPLGALQEGGGRDREEGGARWPRSRARAASGQLPRYACRAAPVTRVPSGLPAAAAHAQRGDGGGHSQEEGADGGGAEQRAPPCARVCRDALVLSRDALSRCGGSPPRASAPPSALGPALVSLSQGSADRAGAGAAPRNSCCGLSRLCRMSGSPGSLGSPLRKAANGDAPKGRGRRVDLAALEREDTGATLTGNLILSAGNPRASLSKDGGQTLMHGGFKRTRHFAVHSNSVAHNSKGVGQQSLLPAGMQKAPPTTVPFFRVPPCRHRRPACAPCAHPCPMNTHLGPCFYFSWQNQGFNGNDGAVSSMPVATKKETEQMEGENNGEPDGSRLVANPTGEFCQMQLYLAVDDH